jgi:RHS repeat-associated protein
LQYVNELVQTAVNSNPGTDNTCDTTYTVLQDAGWNVEGIVASSGNLVERYAYTPYGQRTVYVSGGSADPGLYTPASQSTRVTADGSAATYGIMDFGFQGMLQDQATGLVVTPARVLNLTLDVWQQEEPKGAEHVDGLNLMEALNSNPINRVDPKGTESDTDEESKTEEELKKVTVDAGLKQFEDAPGALGAFAKMFPKARDGFEDVNKLGGLFRDLHTILTTDDSETGRKAYTHAVNTIGDETLKQVIEYGVKLAGGSETVASLYAAVLRDAWSDGSAVGQYIAQVAKGGFVRGVIVSAMEDNLEAGSLKFEKIPCGAGAWVYHDFKHQYWVREPRVYGSFEAAWRWFWGDQEYDWTPYVAPGE